MCTEYCPCKADLEDWNADKHGGSDKAILMSTNELGASKIEECETDAVDKYSMKHYGTFFAAMENSFSCAGFCKTPRYFLFSEVKRGPPKETCR